MNYIFSGTVLDTAIFTSRVVPNAEVTVNNNLQLRTMTGGAHCGAWCSGWQVDISSVDIAFDVTPSGQSYSGTPGTVFVLKKIGATHETTYGWPNTCIIVYLRSGSNTASVTTRVNAAAGTSGTVSFSVLPASVLARVRVTIALGIVKVYVNDTLKASLILSAADKTALGNELVPEWGNGSYSLDGTTLVNNIYFQAVTVEQYASLRIASVAEAFSSLQLAPATRAEAWRGIQVRKATPAEKAYQIYVDAAARLEKAAQLSVIATMGFEQFAGLSVKGSLAAFEQFAGLSIEARERMVFETYRRLAVLGEVDASIFEQSVGLIIDNSIVDFISFAEQGGLYYRQFDVQVNVSPDTFPPRNVQLIRSLPLYASASLVLQSTLLLESGPITQVDRTITLMYDGVQEETRAADQQTGAESVTATLRLVSPTAGLGYLKNDSGSQRFSRSWPAGTMASEIMDELFAGSSLSYDLRIDDFPIGQQLTVDNKFPFEIWPLLFIKERIRTGDDGDTLIVAPVLPCLPADLSTHPLDHDLDPGQYMVQSTIADDGGQIRCNMIRVANYQDADAGAAELAAPELGEADSSGMTTVYGWPVPWRKVWLRGCHLPHDGYELRTEGVAEELELGETISFDNGAGRTQRPIHALLSVDWAGNISLGAVTPSEDGTLTTATAGKSVAVVRYKTRRYKFLYRDAEGDHKMSLWLTDEEA